MVDQSFYNWYDIDDSAIWCGKVITVDCDNLHHYMNLCDLIEECVADLPHDITKECIRTFFNTTIDSLPIWYFLRIDAQHCLEAVNITTLLQCTDIYVKTNAQDATAGYLASKFLSWTDGCFSTLVVPYGPANWQKLKVEVLYPDSPFLCGLPALPSCDGANVLMDMDWTIHYDCGDNQNRYRAQLHLTTDDITINPDAWAFKAYAFPQLWGATWEASMITPTPWAITIPKTGMYEVRMKGEAKISNGVSRVRLTVISNNATRPIVIDSKFGWETLGWSVSPICHANEKRVTYTFTGFWLFKFNAWESIVLACKIDTRNIWAWAEAPQVIRRKTTYTMLTDSVSNSADNSPGLCLGVKRYSALTHWAV